MAAPFGTTVNWPFVALLFLLAYTCSGLAGLVYEVSWTRLLTLYIGHTTAAASAVVAAFLGGLAAGAAGGGFVAASLSPRRALVGYAILELLVVAGALLLPLELRALTPLLRWAYADAASGVLFPVIRLAACLAMVFLPAAALGATFPMAVRWFANRAAQPARASSALYVVNTIGAALGSLLAGFVLIPAIGISGTTWIGVAGSLIAAALVGGIAWREPPDFADRGTVAPTAPSSAATSAQQRDTRRQTGRRPALPTPGDTVPAPASAPWLPMAVLAVSGFAALVHEIAWTRILALVLGPTTYAFAATLAAVIAGVALGSGLGTWLLGRIRATAHAGWLAGLLALAAVTIVATATLAGGQVPRTVAQQIAAYPGGFADLLRRGMLLTALLIVPTAVCLGAAFPMALALAGDPRGAAARRFGLVYAVNTIGSVTGTLAAGFVLIPWLGLPTTLAAAAFCLVATALAIVTIADVARFARLTGYLASGVALAAILFAPPWDHELLASGVYLYAPFVPKDLDLETQLKAGELLYYKDGAPATVSVKRLTGTTTLAVDGKTDASNRSDMLTQKLVAHLPLLLHDRPRSIAIVGLGSGVTLGAALSHPVERADVIEISPEVVEASRFFEAENHRGLSDPRTHLIVGDGRSHLLLSRQQYDVIISEPSNPWIAGVAALFTREFFEGARARLAPGGIICQWAHTYTISERDLRSIVATFRSVFPGGAAFMVNDNDVLMVAAAGPIEDRLGALAANWTTRHGAAEDLAEVGALDPFSVLSLFAAGPAELQRYAEGGDILDDDRMRLEFSAPRELHNDSAADNDASFEALLGADGGPALVRDAKASASAEQWRMRADMMARSDAYAMAYDDYVRALKLDPSSQPTLEGLTRTAVLTSRAQDALGWVRSLTAEHPSVFARIATSKLLAAAGFRADAVQVAQEACNAEPRTAAACDQLASLHADAGNRGALEAVVQTLETVAPGRASTHYYAAAAAFLAGDAQTALARARQAIAADAKYAAAYDMAGAAHTKLGQPDLARQAFQTSLQFDPHDSTAYTNLGLLALAAGRRDEAIDYFAEALWLTPDADAARRGLDEARR